MEVVVELVPVERRRHLRAGPGPHAPRAEHRLVRRVLVEVDEHPRAPLLLPPCRGHQIRAAALELAGQGDRRAPDRVAVPAGLEPEIHVDATVAGGLRPRGEPELGEKIPYEERSLPDHRERDAGRRVEVNA